MIDFILAIWYIVFTIKINIFFITPNKKSVSESMFITTKKEVKK